MRNEEKVALASGFTLLSIAALLSSVLGFRTRADEMQFLLDIWAGVVDARLAGFYLNGDGYQAAVVAILRLSGLNPVDLQLLSPLVGGVIGLVVVLTLLGFYRLFVPSDDRLLLAVVLLGTSTLAIPGFFNRLRETSHKAYTFTLLVGLLFASMLWVRRRDRRYLSLLPLFAFALFGINYLWGAIYSGYTLVMLFGTVSVPTLALGGVIAALSLAVSVRFVATVNPAFFTGLIDTLISFVEQSTSGPGETPPPDGREASAPNPDETDTAGGERSATGPDDSPRRSPSLDYPGNLTAGLSAQIRAWGTYRLGPLVIPRWFTLVGNVAVSAVVTAVATCVAVASTVRPSLRAHRLRLSPPDRLLLVTVAFFGGLFVFSAAAGSIATAKRLIVVPGLLGFLYAVVAISRRSDWRPGRQRLVLLALVVLLLSTTVLATPRFTLNGEGPHDTQAEANQVALAEWHAEHAAGCGEATSRQNQILVAWLSGLRVDLVTEDRGYYNEIYDSGSNGVVACELPS